MQHAGLRGGGQSRPGAVVRGWRRPREPSAHGLAPGASTWSPTLAFGNRYADGAEHVGYHSDFLLSLGPRPVIAGLSLGATRTFRLRSHADDPRVVVSLPTPHNSLIVMTADAQEHWHHALVKTADVRRRAGSAVRYSLTFRMGRPAFAAAARAACKCGRVAALKCKAGRYYLSCNPAGDAGPRCDFFAPSPAAQREAARLRAAGS